jgi:excinuclease ABC subunit C
VTSHGEPWVLLLIAVGYVGLKGYERVREWREPDPMERLHQQYVEGEIGEEEMERRLEVQMDPRNEEIRETVERINGVGPVVSREIAVSFSSLEDVRRADQDELEDVPGVGPERAEAVRERL